MSAPRPLSAGGINADLTSRAALVATILRHLVHRPIGEAIDDRELAGEILLVLSAFAKHLERSGVAARQIHALREDALAAARDAYVELWLRNAREDEPQPIDETAERNDAIREFDLALRQVARR